MLKVLKTFDIFKTLYYHHQSSLPTILGAIASLFFLLTTLFLFFLFGSELINKKKATFIKSKRYLEDTVLQLNSSNFLFAFLLIDKNGQTFSLNQSYFANMLSLYRTQSIYDRYSMIPLSFVLCTENMLKSFEDISNDIKNELYIT